MTAGPLCAATYDTPVGDFTVVVDADAVVRAASLATEGGAALRVPPELAARGIEAGAQPAVADAVEAWLAGEPHALASVPVAQDGGPFTREVWDTLRSVPAGEVVSYQELATMAGRPRAMRAAGTACARNTIALFVPCHRVIQAGGRLGSYGFGGLGIKAALLELEGFAVHGGRPLTADALVELRTDTTARA